MIKVPTSIRETARCPASQKYVSLVISDHALDKLKELNNKMRLKLLEDELDSCDEIMPIELQKNRELPYNQTAKNFIEINKLKQQ